MNRIIWLFRETRSGGTWLASYLSSKLNRTPIFLEEGLPTNLSLFEKIKRIGERTQIDSDYNSILHTHIYELIKMLDRYDNPIVLRCSRKNKFDQFLSWCSVKHSDYSFYNLQKNLDTTQNNLYQNFISKQIQVTRQDYIQWQSYELNRIDKFWKLANSFENYTIYYEDMVKGTAGIPCLNLYNIKMNDEGLILKLPDSYKKDKIINYNEVREWFNNDQT